MIPVAWMAGVSMLSWLAVSVGAGQRVNPEALFGMLGPLLSASATWVAVRIVYGSTPERLTAVLIAGFGVKMVFFGAYVAGMLRWLDLRPVPFVASFTAYFIALYAMEALFLRRLTMATSR
jgi:hypothetical protein